MHDAFQEFSQKVFADGALDKKTKQLIAVAVAHVTQCGYCIRGHTKAFDAPLSTPEHRSHHNPVVEAWWFAAFPWCVMGYFWLSDGDCQCHMPEQGNE
ncbi:carboxymuconolactone decarboxylase family protein [Marinobacter sp. LV10R510-11A]|uniref:carboxymuconolactone decarboxylase family protein n=1 Tax=Marinobacter sp. LV10R510-11A TaxID=1415568 RepID=UPI0018D58046